MKTIFLSVCLLVAGATMAQPATPTPTAEMTFKSETHDYGTVKQGANGDCEFVFTNTGNVALVISDAQGSCGCTIPEWPKEPIKPGDKAVIKVHYNTSRPGPINKYVTLFANVEGGSKKIYIKGTVEAPTAANAPVKKDETMAPTAK